MDQNHFPQESCDDYTKIENLDCRLEKLFLIEELPSPDRDRYFLKGCRQCGQVYQEIVWGNDYNGPYRKFYRIKGQKVNQCYCIGFLEPVEILSEVKSCEGDSMYFSWSKETKMRCRKCGKFYRENISQSNYDGFYFQKYTEY